MMLYIMQNNKSILGQKKSVEIVNSWESATAQTLVRIESLRTAIKVFEERKRVGEPWPGIDRYTATQEASESPSA